MTHRRASNLIAPAMFAVSGVFLGAGAMCLYDTVYEMPAMYRMGFESAWRNRPGVFNDADADEVLRDVMGPHYVPHQPTATHTSPHQPTGD